MDAQARVKALEAIKYAILNNEYDTPAMEQLKEEEEVSKRATAMVNNEDYEPEFKNKVNKKILSDYREEKKELLAEDAQQKKVIVEQSKDDMKELENLKEKVSKYEKEHNMNSTNENKENEDSEKENNNVLPTADTLNIDDTSASSEQVEKDFNGNIYSSNDKVNEEDESII